MFLAQGNLPVTPFFFFLHYWDSCGFNSQPARHYRLANSSLFFISDCLHFYSRLPLQLVLWFNFPPSHLVFPFGITQVSLSRLCTYALVNCLPDFVLHPVTRASQARNSSLLRGHLPPAQVSSPPRLATCRSSDAKKNTSPKQASPVKSYSLYAIPSVLTQQVIQISGVPTFCKVTHLLCQFRFACAMYHILARASFPPCRCQQRSCLRIDFPLVRRQGFLQPFGSLPMLGKQKGRPYGRPEMVTS